MRFASIFRLFFLLSCLAFPVLAAEPSFFDWVETEDPSYALLKKAALESGQSGWIVTRLKEGKRLPQASARDLAGRLQDDPSVSDEDKKALKDAFPPEIAVLEPGFQKVQKHVDELSDHMDLVDAQLQAFEKAWRSNIIGALSDPSCFVYAGSGISYGSSGGLYGNGFARKGYVAGGIGAPST
jgi:hypothetical protein